MAKGEIFLLLGPEKGKKKDFLNSLYKKLKTTSGTKPEIYKLYPFEDSADKIISTIQNSSLFSSSKMVVISDADTINAADAGAIGDCLQKVPADTYIIFSTDQTAASKVSTKVTKPISKQNRKVFWEMFDSDKKSWILTFFRKNNQQISTDAVDIILDMVENNTEELKNNCSTLSLFYADKTVITIEMIEEFLYHSKEENAFTLFDKLAEKNTPAAMEILNKIISSGNTHYILLCGGLLFQFRKLLSLRQMAGNSYPDTAAMQQLKINGKKQQKTYKTAFSKYSLKQAEEALQNLLTFELFVRTSPTELHKSAAELFIYSITQNRKYLIKEQNLYS
jgi:DNA polymerase-3 subunit delta